jgi:hypothetical protein
VSGNQIKPTIILWLTTQNILHDFFFKHWTHIPMAIFDCIQLFIKLKMYLQCKAKCTAHYATWNSWTRNTCLYLRLEFINVLNQDDIVVLILSCFNFKIIMWTKLLQKIHDIDWFVEQSYYLNQYNLGTWYLFLLCFILQDWDYSDMCDHTVVILLHVLTCRSLANTVLQC